ncbi:MAG: hydrogenase maturation protease [Gemmatimonadota bacterium]|nr:hydrogenase maturation protease [Gemmatimonadota bacterium]
MTALRTAAGKRVLVLGWGNPGRRDDGLGPAFVERVRGLELPGVESESAYQLQVEHAGSVAEADVVVFVDADISAPAPFRARRLEPEGHPAFSTHALSPGSVLALAGELFDARPEAVLVGVRGYEFDGFGEGLSEGATANLAAAAAWFAGEIEASSRPAPPAAEPCAGRVPAHHG